MTRRCANFCGTACRAAVGFALCVLLIVLAVVLRRGSRLTIPPRKIFPRGSQRLARRTGWARTNLAATFSPA